MDDSELLARLIRLHFKQNDDRVAAAKKVVTSWSKCRPAHRLDDAIVELDALLYLANGIGNPVPRPLTVPEFLPLPVLWMWLKFVRLWP